MITLYITDDCQTCARIRALLDEMSFEHETVIVLPDDRSYELPPGTLAPVLVDNDEVIEGRDGILAHIRYLRELRAMP